MEDLEAMLRGVLSDPQQLEKLSGMAEALGLGPAPPEEAPPSAAPREAPPPPLSPPPPKPAQQGPHEALLQALKPFLKPERRAKLERAMQLAKLSRLAETVLK